MAKRVRRDVLEQARIADPLEAQRVYLLRSQVRFLREQAAARRMSVSDVVRDLIKDAMTKGAGR